MLKRIFLFLALNFVIVLTLSLLLQIFHVQPYLTHYGLDLRSLASFCLIWGMGGAMISLLLSRKIAKWMLGVTIIDPREMHNPRSMQLFQTVVRLSQRLGLPEVPQVGIFHSPEANAFATGPSKKSSLVAVSTGLLDQLSDEEVEAVIGHELAHIANGDMVTMTLLQGVVNAFVMFLARFIAYAVSGLGRDRDSRSSSSPFSFYALTFIFEIIFMILGSLLVAAFSRYREFRADKGSALLLGKAPMISALKRLHALEMSKYASSDKRIETVEALMITKPKYQKALRFFSTHPPLEMRIARLEALSSATAAEITI